MRGQRSPSVSLRRARPGVVLMLGIGLGTALTALVLHGQGGRQSDVVGLAAASGDPTVTPQGLAILGNSCSNSDLTPHTGFQEAPRCVSTAFGEVGAAAQNPSLLITGSPRVVRVGQSFTIRVSTRNLVRDRFLGAAAGGYYLESSYLNLAGLQRGHFHTACRMLDSARQAPDPAPVPAFFKATEDGGGSSTPDTVSVTVSGLPRPGMAQCAVWAGDGSHRIPMMQRANETPAFDVVRILVRPARGNPSPSPAPSASPPASAPPSSPEPSPAASQPSASPGASDSPAGTSSDPSGGATPGS
jgi:hypothetical protein